MTKLMESLAAKTIYEFFNSAEQNGEIGIHLSVHDAKTGEIHNMFFDLDRAEQMLRALGEIVPMIRNTGEAKEKEGP